MSGQREFISVDWVLKILVGIAAFFLTMTYLTVKDTAKDVSDLKVNVSHLQDKYEDVSNRVQLLEHLK